MTRVYIKTIEAPFISLDVYYIDVYEDKASLLIFVPQALRDMHPKFLIPSLIFPSSPLLIAGYIGAMEKPL